MFGIQVVQARAGRRTVFDRRARPVRRGVTLIELLVASVVMVMIAGGVALLASAVQSANDFTLTTFDVTQHARVCLERIQRGMKRAYANETFPGMVAFSASNGGYSFPDTVVVWDPPSGTPADASGLPRVGELTIFCPALDAPNKLLELTMPGDTDVVPLLSDTAGWDSLLTKLKSSTLTTQRVLTTKLRMSSAGGGKRGNVRFEIQLRPSDETLIRFRGLDASSKSYTVWRQLGWPQDYYSQSSGIRQVWCRIELQLVADPEVAASDVFPFLDSVALYYSIPY